MVIDVDTYERALALAGELSAAPGAGGKPIRSRTPKHSLGGYERTATAAR